MVFLDENAMFIVRESLAIREYENWIDDRELSAARYIASDFATRHVPNCKLGERRYCFGGMPTSSY